MADIIRHARAVSPYFIPNNGGLADDFHGITAISGGATVDSEDVYVVGKSEKCGTDTAIPDSSVPITQLERGEIQTYLTLANLDAEPVSGITLLDFSDALVDVILYEKDEYNGNVEKTVWFPKTAIANINLDIADPEARLERSFELTGDNKIELSDDNKVLIYVTDTAPSGTSGNYVIDVSDPAPVADPNNSGAYILRIDRIRSGVKTELVLTTDYTFNTGTNEITILSALTNDEFRIYYSAIAFGTAGDPTTVDTGNPCFIGAENTTVLLSDGTTEVELDLLTSLSISATLNRIDESVIGNDEKILREVSDKTVDVAITGRVKESTWAKAFMGKLGTTWGITDVKKFLSNARVTVKVYSDSTKSTFLIGYQVDSLAFASDSEDFTANEFGVLNVSSSSDNLLITTSEANLT